MKSFKHLIVLLFFQFNSEIGGAYASPVYEGEGLNQLHFTFDSRALSFERKEGMHYFKFRFKNNIPDDVAFEYGEVIPWAGKRGLGVQVKSSKRFNELWNEGNGVLEIVEHLEYRSGKWVKIAYSTQFELLGAAHAPCEIGFDLLKLSENKAVVPVLFIKFTLPDKRMVRVSVTGNDIEAKRISFNNFYFSNEEIRNEANVFRFDVIETSFNEGSLQGTLSSVHPDYKAIRPNLKEYDGEYYLLIYSSRRSHPARSYSEDVYGDDIYYIHGIWEVELSEDFKKKGLPIGNT